MPVCPPLRRRVQRDHSLDADDSDGVANPLSKMKSNDRLADLFGSEMVNPVADPSPRATGVAAFKVEGVPADDEASV